MSRAFWRSRITFGLPSDFPFRFAFWTRVAWSTQIPVPTFNADVLEFLKSTGLTPKRTSVQSPWQNGIAERWVGSCRRELLDHVIPINEVHLRRLVREYVSYYHEDRIHDSLQKDTPNTRAVQPKPSPVAVVISKPRVGGLHHRYDWHEAA